MTESNYKEVVANVLLDFEGNEHILTKQKGAVFNIYNLDGVEPIVQLNEDIYKGSYDEAMGTNLFFEKEDRQQTCIFEPQTNISLKYAFKQSKLIILKKIGTNEKIQINTDVTDSVKINLPRHYKEILEKYSKGEWNIEDYIVDASELEKDDGKNSTDSSQLECSLSNQERANLGWFSETTEKENECNTYSTESLENRPVSPRKYIELLQLLDEPVKLMTNRKAALENLDDKSTFKIWEELVLEHTAQQSINLNVDKDKIEDFVDVKGSIDLGIIEPSQQDPRIFTNDEKNKLISFKNFYNLTPILKLKLLQEHIEAYKSLMNEGKGEDLNKIDGDGYSLLQKLELFENLYGKLKSDIILRIKKESRADVNTENFEFLENDEDHYESDEENVEQYSSSELSDDELENQLQ